MMFSPFGAEPEPISFTPRGSSQLVVATPTDVETIRRDLENLKVQSDTLDEEVRRHLQMVSEGAQRLRSLRTLYDDTYTSLWEGVCTSKGLALIVGYMIRTRTDSLRMCCVDNAATDLGSRKSAQDFFKSNHYAKWFIDNYCSFPKEERKYLDVQRDVDGLLSSVHSAILTSKSHQSHPYVNKRAWLSTVWPKNLRQLTISAAGEILFEVDLPVLTKVTVIDSVEVPAHVAVTKDASL